jgi:hypothetical protein
MKIEVIVAERSDAFKLLKGADAEVGQKIFVAPGLTAVFQGARVQKSANYPTVASFEVEGSGADAGEKVWSWLTSTLPSGAQGVAFDGIDAPYEEASVKRIVSSKLAG